MLVHNSSTALNRRGENSYKSIGAVYTIKEEVQQIGLRRPAARRGELAHPCDNIPAHFGDQRLIDEGGELESSRHEVGTFMLFLSGR